MMLKFPRRLYRCYRATYNWLLIDRLAAWLTVLVLDGDVWMVLHMVGSV